MTENKYMIDFDTDRVAPEKAVHLEPPYCVLLSRNTTRGIDMKTIKLTQGQITLVDDSDFEWLNKWKWHTQKSISNEYKAVRNCRCPFSGNVHLIYMHRQIMSCPRGMEIDHRNHNTLNNQKLNLRICTRTGNNRNSRIRKDNTSGYKGVSWSKSHKKWRTIIGQHIHLGLFNTKEEGAFAYDKTAIKLFGEFANLNFPNPQGV